MQEGVAHTDNSPAISGKSCEFASRTKRSEFKTGPRTETTFIDAILFG